jgi:hypothetical protein
MIIFWKDEGMTSNMELFGSRRELEIAALCSYGFTTWASLLVDTLGEDFACVAALCAVYVEKELKGAVMTVLINLRETCPSARACNAWFVDHNMELMFLNDRDAERKLDAMILLCQDDRFADIFAVNLD